MCELGGGSKSFLLFLVNQQARGCFYGQCLYDCTYQTHSIISANQESKL